MTLARLKRRAAARREADFGDHSPAPTMTPQLHHRTRRVHRPTQRSQRDQDNRQDDKRAFASVRHTTDPYLDQMVLTPANKVYVGAGTLIPAVLLTGINSDLPGMITAQVAETIYDTVTGKHVLIPQGSTLIGEYDSRITYGQERVLFVWTRVRFPNGSSISLEGMPELDLSGFSGVRDKVDNHWETRARRRLGSLSARPHRNRMAVASVQRIRRSANSRAAGAAQNINSAASRSSRRISRSSRRSLCDRANVAVL
jgi:type IV secretion system protein VirB10